MLYLVSITTYITQVTSLVQNIYHMSMLPRLIHPKTVKSTYLVVYCLGFRRARSPLYSLALYIRAAIDQLLPIDKYKI